MDIRASLLPDSKPLQAVEPRQRALYHPTVAPQLLTRLNAAPGNPREDAPGAQASTDVFEVIAFVRVSLPGAFSVTVRVWAS